MAKVTIIGAGAFGTALSIYMRRKGHNPTIWCFEKDLPELVKSEKENKRFLPGFELPEDILFTTDPAEAVDNTELALFVVPSAYLRQTARLFSSHIKKGTLILSAAKGIEDGTFALMSQVLEEELHEHVGNTAFLSGPSFAKDVARGLPTDLSCASKPIETARAIQEMIHSPELRIYTNDDVIGVETGGALKNVIAIACGVADGLGLGLSARASLITRGLAEITRLGTRLGADPLTFQGLSGVGDLILTCTGDLSRNRTLGMKLSEGIKASEIIANQLAVAEGYVTAKPVHALAKSLGVEMPISEAVYRVCYEEYDLRGAVNSLMTRSKKDEFSGIKDTE